MATVDLNSSAQALVADGKGLLAAEETPTTLTRRFDALYIDSTPESRRSYCELFRHDCVIKNEVPPFPDEQRAKGPLQECLSGLVGSQHSRQAVVGHGLQGLSQGHTACRCVIIEQGGEVAPIQLWHAVPSFVTVGSALYSSSPLLRNLCIL